jgi:tetratricopeptide (TPR) repeat protein
LNEPKAYRAIMLSSTFTDLREHRERATKAIEKFGYRANVMEHDGARADTDVIESSLNMVRDSAGYICVISFKYGQTPSCAERNPDWLSITELEFNEAMRLGRPIVLFVMDDEHPTRKADIESDPGKLEKLDTFRERAKRMGDRSKIERVYEMFETLEQFSTAAAIAVGRLAQHLDRQGALQRSPAPNVKGASSPKALSNIPVTVPLHFLGRGEYLAAIDATLRNSNGRVAITALYGLRGVGKTTLAAAYAERYAANYRATWWIEAQTDPTMRADLVALGVQLGWVAPTVKEDPAVTVVMERLRHEGEDLLLIYDDANGPDQLRKYLPHVGAARVIVTSNAPNWRGIAATIEIEVWPKEVGANYLIAGTGRDREREAALVLSEALEGLPLGHVQAAAYCDRLGVSLAEYHKRFERAPDALLDDQRDASTEYHDGRTVAKTFALAIDEAAKLHPAAEPLIVYAALLAPEPIPLFLFSEAREQFGEPFASALAGDGLDEAVGALRTFALVNRETIADERDPSIATDCIHLHRLVRQVVATRREGRALEDARRALIRGLIAVYPAEVWNNPTVWPRARRLDALTMALIGSSLPHGTEEFASILLDGLAAYRYSAMAAHAEARMLYERALALAKNACGPEDPIVAKSINNLARVLIAQGDLGSARPLCEQSLEINEKRFGPDHPGITPSLNTLGYLLRMQNDLAGARRHYQRALEIRERALGPNHPDTARSLSNLGSVLQAQSDLAGARPYIERALAIRQRVLDPDHPETAQSLNDLGMLLQAQSDIIAARPYLEHALAINEKVLGPTHPSTQTVAENTAIVLDRLGQKKAAKALLERFGIGG